jgi:type III pantothenate kinase
MRLLADIGNHHIHVFDNNKVAHLSIDDALQKYGAKPIRYISVRDDIDKTLATYPKWENITDRVHMDGEYAGMGVDRRALCLSRGDGIYIDAGSAVTVDKVLNDRYEGGYILPGIHAYRKAFASIASVLDEDIQRDTPIDQLPKGTQKGMSYGIISSIISSIEQIRNGLPVYCTGGDGEWIASHIDGAMYDERLVFEGILNALRSR